MENDTNISPQPSSLSGTAGHPTGPARDPAAGSHPQNGPPPAAYQQNSNPQLPDRPSPPRKASQFANVGKANISRGYFPVLTDDSPAEGEFNVINGVEELNITGGLFINGSKNQVLALIKDTEDVAKRAFGVANARDTKGDGLR